MLTSRWHGQSVSGIMGMKRRRSTKRQTNMSRQGNTMANTHSDHLGYRLGRATVRAFNHMKVWVKCLALVMRRKGMPDGLALALAWVAAMAVVGVSLYMLFWLTLFVLVAGCAILVVANLKPIGTEDWLLREDEDHRNSPFYDPINFNDDPDPRFDEDPHRRR